MLVAQPVFRSSPRSFAGTVWCAHPPGGPVTSDPWHRFAKNWPPRLGTETKRKRSKTKESRGDDSELMRPLILERTFGAGAALAGPVSKLRNPSPASRCCKGGEGGSIEAPSGHPSFLPTLGTYEVKKQTMKHARVTAQSLPAARIGRKTEKTCSEATDGKENG